MRTIMFVLGLICCAGCARNTQTPFLSVNEHLPAMLKDEFKSRIATYAFRSQMASRLMRYASATELTDQNVADQEWYALGDLLPTDECPALRNCRTIRPGMIAVPRISEDQICFELVRIEESRHHYQIQPRGVTVGAR